MIWIPLFINTQYLQYILTVFIIFFFFRTLQYVLFITNLKSCIETTTEAYRKIQSITRMLNHNLLSSQNLRNFFFAFYCSLIISKVLTFYPPHYIAFSLSIRILEFVLWNPRSFSVEIEFSGFWVSRLGR